MKIEKLSPAFKDYLWGGTKLRDVYGKKCDYEKVAESWELSTHPAGQSVIDGGEYDGLKFGEYLEKVGAKALGVNGAKFKEFPVLIKFIDAKQPLSVQVHPSDEYALRVEGEYGKTEMWYVVDCEPGASLYFGVNRALTKEEFKKRIEDNTLTDVLYKADVKKGDVFFIQSGTIHAIGAGILICEIQQNSNTTYRVYDYGRRGADGKLRELHIDKAIDVSKLTPSDTSDKQGKPEEIPGGTKCALASCPYFTTEKYVVDGEVEIDVTGDSFASLVVTEGSGKLETAEDVNVNGTRKNVAYYTPSEPGVSYLTATTKDGQYHVNFAVVCLPVQANTLRLDDTRATLHPLETLALNATLTPTPTRAEDAALTWTSFNPEVATVDENGVVTAHKPGYAYIKVSTDINTSVTAYCVVEVLPGQGYTVTLDANGGTVKPDSVSVQYGMAVGQLPVPVREGYTFDGWYDENGAQYTEDTIYAIAGDTTLTARWTANIYEITLDANGGVTDVALVQVTFGQAVGALPTPTREGYVFLGWFDEAGSRYDASTVYSTADGVTLTARWGQEDSTFTITLDANGGTVKPSALAVVYGQAVGALPVPTREGYTFGGWYDKDGNRYDASSVYSVKGDTTLTARWIENSVQTGDGFPIFLLSGAMMGAAAGAVMLLLKRRKLMGE